MQQIFRFLLQKHSDTSFKSQAEEVLAKADRALSIQPNKGG